MVDRRYKPGHRRSPQLRGTGKMSEDRFAWLKTAVGQFVILRKKEEEDTETGPTIRLLLPRPGGRPMSYNLTALTEQELAMTRQFFNLLFDEAEPIVKQRDKVAQDALDQGDDSHARVYRAVPQFVIRQGAQRGHSEGVFDRPSSNAPGARGDPSLLGGVRDDSSELANGEPEEGGSEDDWEEINEP